MGGFTLLNSLGFGSPKAPYVPNFRALRYLTITSCAFFLAFVIPNTALAQAPTFQPVQQTRLPWQTRPIVIEPVSFDNGWTRVLLDTERLLRRFAPRRSIRNIVTIDALARATATRALWASSVRNYAPPAPALPRMNVGTIRATMMPIAYSTKTTTESRANEGVIGGVHFQLIN